MRSWGVESAILTLALLAALMVIFLPAQLLVRWTIEERRLAGRAILQAALFGGLILFVIPAMAGTTVPMSRALQLPAVFALLALAAVQELVERGGGTPFP